MNHQGYIRSTPAELDAFDEAVCAYQISPYFADVAPHLKESGKGKLSTPYKSLMKFVPTLGADEAQTTGDCTSHGTRNACDLARAVDIDIKGELESWEARGATEGIYGARGHGGQGMSPAMASQWVQKFGVLIRKKYPFADLSVYNAEIGARWGGQGPPKAACDEAAKTPTKYICRAESTDDVRDALFNGFGVHCGSDLGFSNKRDAHGFAARSGSWSHDMPIYACDDRPERPGFLFGQDWGLWCAGGEPEWGPIPVGSFMVGFEDVAWAIKGGDVWIVGDVSGFPARDLPDYGTSWA